MRKTIIVEIDAEGRDHGKKFEIEEMPAFQSSNWATRAALLIFGSGGKADGMASLLGQGGFNILDSLGGADPVKVQGLIDELLSCVSFVATDGAKHKLLETVIEEPTTIFKLAQQAFKLHVNFTNAATK